VSEPESLVLELVDLEPKTVVLGPKIARVVAHYNCKDSDTQDVA
jgi:hypothetical protein